MRAKKGHWVVVLGIALLLLITVLFLVFRLNNTHDADVSQYVDLAKSTGLTLYETDDDKRYVFQAASAEDQAIVLATYASPDGVITLTQQPKPVTDPFGSTKPADSFATRIGNARIYPDDKGEPYVIIDAPLTWLIIRSPSEAVTSAKLKEFCLSLSQVPRSN